MVWSCTLQKRICVASHFRTSLGWMAVQTVWPTVRLKVGGKAIGRLERIMMRDTVWSFCSGRLPDSLRKLETR